MTNLPTVAVRGEVTREFAPEIAIVYATVSTRSADREVAMRQLAERLDAVRAVLAGCGEAVEKQETAWLSVSPQYSGQSRRITGYVGNATTTATVGDFAVIGDLLLGLGGLPETSVGGPSWELRPDSPTYRQTRHEALHAAVERARDYASALGSTLVSLVEIADSGLAASAPPAMTFAATSRAASASDAQLTVDPQRQRVYASVEARFTMSEPKLP